jgi:hypothetical protein
MTRPQDIDRDSLEAATARRLIAAERPPLLAGLCRHCREPEGDHGNPVAIWTGGFVHGACWPDFATRTYWRAADRARQQLGLPEF